GSREGVSPSQGERGCHAREFVTAVTQTPADTTCPCEAAVSIPSANCFRNCTCRSRVNSTNGLHTACTKLCLINKCQKRFDRLYRYDIARYRGTARQSSGLLRQIEARENSR